MATSDRSHGTSMIAFARGANDVPSCGGKHDSTSCRPSTLPAPESKSSTRMMAKLTRLQHKVADESCRCREKGDLPSTPTDEPTSSSRFCHCPLVTPDSIDLGQSDSSDASDASDGQVASKRRRERRQGKELVRVRVDSSSDGDASSATDITETLTMSVSSLGHGSSTPSSSLKSCLSSSTKGFDRRRRGTGKLNHRRHVHFDSIRIRRYQVILGDHPDVSVGPPLGLGWNFCSIGPIPLDAYEKHRSEKDRRKGNELVLPAFMRRQILLRNNLSTSAEIAERVKEVKAIQSQRDLTVKLLPFAKVEEGAQSAKRKAARAASRVLNRKSSPSDTNKNCNPRNDSGGDQKKGSRHPPRSQSFATFDRRRSLLRLQEQYRSSQF